MVAAGERPLRADARRNREKVLRCAHDAFAEHGVDASLEDVAARAGVGVGTLYRHFPTRNDLVEALLRDRLSRLRERAETLAEDDPSRDAVATWLAECAAGASIYRASGTVAAAMQEPGTALYDSCHAMTDAASTLLARAAERGAIRSDVDPDDVFGLVAGAAWISDRSPDPDRRRRLVGLVVDALRP